VADLGKLTRRLESGLGRLLGTQTGDASEPLELVNGILRDIEHRVEPIGGGHRRFPYNTIGVTVLAVNKEEQDRYDSALSDLEPKIRERLRELACDQPGRLEISVQFAKKPRKGWAADQRVELTFSREAQAAVAARATREREAPVSSAVRLVVMRGAAAKRTYSFEQRVIRFGRGEDHAEASGRSRRNDIAFLDDQDEVNRTVARAQAHLEFDAERREFRLFDDGSSNGTRIVRDAEIITVTPHGPRGVRVASGDILEFGRARVRFEVEA
jgi:FHA domain-containing protein